MNPWKQKLHCVTIVCAWCKKKVQIMALNHVPITCSVKCKKARDYEVSKAWKKRNPRKIYSYEQNIKYKKINELNVYKYEANESLLVR